MGFLKFFCCNATEKRLSLASVIVCNHWNKYDINAVSSYEYQWKWIVCPWWLHPVNESCFYVFPLRLSFRRLVNSASTILGITEAILSVPHIDEFAVEFVYIYYWGEPDRAPHRRVCEFFRHSLFQKLFTNYSTRRHEPPYLLDGNSKDGDHSWTYLFND